MGQKESKPSSSGKYKKSLGSRHPPPVPVDTNNVTREVTTTTAQQPRLPQPVTTNNINKSAAAQGQSLSSSAKPTNTKISDSKDTSQSTLESYYQKYKDSHEDAILAEGVENFCEDLGVSPTDFIVLVLAWKFKASEMCRFTREEFTNGCQKLKAKDAKGLKMKFPELIRETNESEKSFKDLYQFTFTFGLDHPSGQRSLPAEMAIQLWDLLFTHRRDKYPLLGKWVEFLEVTGVKSITRDTWNMLLPFLSTMKDNFNNYDESEAWPTLFDDFVEYEQAKTNN